VPKVNAGDLPPLKLTESGDAVRIEGSGFAARFSRGAGTLVSLVYGGREILAPGTSEIGGPVLQIWRAPTDNDRGFGKWLARDWREAGLTNPVRRVDLFEATRAKPNEVRVTIVSTSTWIVRGDGSLDMDNVFEPSIKLATLPRIGVVMHVAEPFDRLRWYGRGPQENYSDRKQSADVGIWSGTVDEQYVPYVRPQDNGNKEDVRWAALTDAAGQGLLVVAEESPVAFSALHYTAADLAAVKHRHELKPRAEVVLSLDARQCGLGNGSCGPGVLERYAVPPQVYRLHLRLCPCPAGSDAEIAAPARRDYR
jgi:beta-galactosidase